MHLTRALSLLLIAVAVPQAHAQGLGASAVNAAVVQNVSPGSLAAAAGLKPGDVILDIDGTPVRNTQELANLTRTLSANPMTIDVWRAGQRLVLRVNPKPAVVGDVAAAPAVVPVRPAGGSAVPAAGGPSLGNYGCTERWLRGTVFSGEWVTELKGYFELMPGGRYHYLDGGDVGQYTYDPGTRKLQFQGGYFGNINATGEYTPRETGGQIDIVIPSKSRTDRWMCGSNKK